MENEIITADGLVLRAVPGHKNYWADGANGDIYSTWGPGSGPWGTERQCPPKRKAQRRSSSGYATVGLVVTDADGRRRKKLFTVHRLICQTYYGPIPQGSEVRHLNGRKTDNRAANLRASSTALNFKDKIKHDRRIKLNKTRVKEIRRLLIDGIPFSQIAGIYRVGYHTVYMIAQALTWKGPGYGITEEFRNWQREYLPRHMPPQQATIDRLIRATIN